MNTRSNIFNSSCNDCNLCEGSRLVCAPDVNAEEHRPLAIFTDAPDYFADNCKKPYALQMKKFLEWLLLSMDVSPSDVALCYTLRCYGKGMASKGSRASMSANIEACSSYRYASLNVIRPKAIVGLGAATCLAFTGRSPFKDYVGTRIKIWESVLHKFTTHIHISYSPLYVMMFAGDTPNVFATIFSAAEEAGLKPKLNPKIPPFVWEIRK